MTSYKVLKITDFNFSEFGSLVGIITPQLAAELLALNMENNRKISSSVVNRYRQSMQEGDWHLSDPIKFSNTGTMIDGQHRLSALIQSGTSQLFVCLTGYDQKSSEVLDQGKKRLAIDIAKLRGLNFSLSHISIMRMLITMADGFIESKGNGLTSPGIVSACQVYSDLLNFSLRHSNKTSSIGFAPVLASVALAYPYEDHNRLEEFLFCWHTGTVVKGVEDNAAIVLRDMYHKSSGEWTSGATQRLRFSLKAQAALVAFLQGRNVSHIKGLNSNKWNAQEFKVANLKKKIKEFDASNA